MIAGLLGVVSMMPFAIGGTLGIAYVAGEAIVFAMMLWWAIAIARGERRPLPGVGSIAIPLAALVGYAGIQLVPLPPPLVGLLSPSAYQLYQRSFPGWPKTSPGVDFQQAVASVAEHPSGNRSARVLPTIEEVKRGAAVPFVPSGDDEAKKAAADAPGIFAKLSGWFTVAIYGTRWRPLTICPPQTWGAMLLLAACSGIILLAGFFPLAVDASPETEIWHLRIMIGSLILIGTAVATVGLIQQATWNGKILWVYVPYDWGAPHVGGTPRASGPFVNPDHFAGFLAMIFPLAAAGAIFRNSLVPRSWSAGCRIICATFAFLMFIAILLSESRAGWISVMVGTVLLCWLALSSRESDSQTGRWRARNWKAINIAMGALTAMLVLATLYVGANQVSDTGARLHSTVSEVGDLAGRLEAWKGGARIMRDFPLVGTGLASWAEIFARYAQPPWTEDFFSEAHNDYIQFVAETGVIGLVLLGWLAWRLIAKLARGYSTLSSRMKPVAAALFAAMAVIAVIECFDFDLQLPANTMMFALIAGLAVRVTKPGAEGAERKEIIPLPLVGRLAALGAAVILIACFFQGRVPYPYNLVEPGSVADARRTLIEFPANPSSHLWLTKILRDQMDHDSRERELATAVWLDPTNPTLRDRYADALNRDGKSQQAIQQIRESVFDSPIINNHPYLQPRVVVWLPQPMLQAIEEGFRRAVAAKFNGALAHLGLFYEQFGRFSDEAAMYQRAASAASDSSEKFDLWIAAGKAAARAAESELAESLVNQAIAIEPDNPSGYQTMINYVFELDEDVDGMQKTVARAIKSGVDGYTMWVTLAASAGRLNQVKVQERALKQVLSYRPDSMPDLLALANLYIATGNSDRAVAMMMKATSVRPDSADAFLTLARAEDASYSYVDADKAYSRAMDLAPQNQYVRTSYASFKERMKKSSAAPASDAAR